MADFTQISRATEEVQIQPIIVALLACFTLFGIGMVQFWSLFSKLKISGKGNQWKDVAILTLLLLTDVVDSVGKAVFFVIWLREIITLGPQDVQKFSPWVLAPCLTNGWTALCVHAIYSRRLWRIIPDKQTLAKGLVFITLLISLIQFTGSIMTGILFTKPMKEWVPHIYSTGSVWFGGASIVDILLCVSMVYYLRRHKGELGGERKGNESGLITRFVFLTIDTAMVPALLQLTELGLFLGMPDNHIHFAIALCMPKVYVNGVLVLLKAALTSRSKGARFYGIFDDDVEIQVERELSSQNKWQRMNMAQGVVISSNVHTVQETMPYQEPVRLAVRQSSNDSLRKEVLGAASEEKPTSTDWEKQKEPTGA